MSEPSFHRILPVSKLDSAFITKRYAPKHLAWILKEKNLTFFWDKTPKGVGEQAGGVVSLRGETSASQKVETVTDHKQLHNFFDGKCSLGIAILTLSLAWGVKTDGVRDQKLLDLNDQPDREAVQPPPQEVRDWSSGVTRAGTGLRRTMSRTWREFVGPSPSS
jgi:hypothetical protein